MLFTAAFMMVHSTLPSMNFAIGEYEGREGDPNRGRGQTDLSLGSV